MFAGIHYLLVILAITSSVVCIENATEFSLDAPIRKLPSNSLTIGEKSYYFQTVFKVNYFLAFQFCNRHGMRLVSITSRDESDKLEKFVEEIGMNYQNFWTAGTELPERGMWVWLTTGDIMHYTNWYPGEPSNVDAKEQCVVARTIDKRGLTWNNIPCNTEHHFICESTADQKNCLTAKR